MCGVQVSLPRPTKGSRRPLARNSGQSHRVVSPEGGCEEGSWKEDGLDLFFRPGGWGGKTKRRRGDGDVTVGPAMEPSCAASQRIPRSSSHHDDFIPPDILSS